MRSELWVGAPGADGFQGTVYRFTRDSSGWTAASKSSIPGLADQAQTLYGWTLASNNEVAVVGIPGQDFTEGATALFTRSTKGWNLSRRLTGDIISLTALTGAKRDCTAGKVSMFDCQQVDLMAFLPGQGHRRQTRHRAERHLGLYRPADGA